MLTSEEHHNLIILRQLSEKMRLTYRELLDYFLVDREDLDYHIAFLLKNGLIERFESPIKDFDKIVLTAKGIRTLRRFKEYEKAVYNLKQELGFPRGE